MNTQPLALRVTGLTKSYPCGFLGRTREVALQALDLRVPVGEIFGYLGPNGSGKTTTLKIVLGLCRADAGTVSVLGCAPGDTSWCSRVGYLPEQPYLHEFLTCREYLDYVGRLFALPQPRRRKRIDELIGLVDLQAAADQRLRTYSKGMLQRAALAQALMNDPELVFLDEPMSGLDPLGRRLVRDIILDLRREGCTVVFSTHILSDAEALCDRVGLLRGGSLLAVGPLDEILRMHVQHLEMLVTGVAAADLKDVLGAGTLRHSLGGQLRLEVPKDGLGAAVVGVEQAGGHVLQVNPVRQSLEDYFIQELDSKGKPSR